VALYGTPFGVRLARPVEIPGCGHDPERWPIGERSAIPRPARAVGAAGRGNRSAEFIPCHGPCGRTQAPLTYHWGLARKRAMLDLLNAPMPPERQAGDAPRRKFGPCPFFHVAVHPAFVALLALRAHHPRMAMEDEPADFAPEVLAARKENGEIPADIGDASSTDLYLPQRRPASATYLLRLRHMSRSWLRPCSRLQHGSGWRSCAPPGHHPLFRTGHDDPHDFVFPRIMGFMILLARRGDAPDLLCPDATHLKQVVARPQWSPFMSIEYLHHVCASRILTQSLEILLKRARAGAGPVRVDNEKGRFTLVFLRRLQT